LSSTSARLTEEGDRPDMQTNNEHRSGWRDMTWHSSCQRGAKRYMLKIAFLLQRTSNYIIRLYFLPYQSNNKNLHTHSSALCFMREQWPVRLQYESWFTLHLTYIFWKGKATSEALLFAKKNYFI
jgi:hypothetical protein